MTRYRIKDSDIKIPFTEAEEKEADALEAANPPFTLDQFKVQKIDKMKSKLSDRYKWLVDRYYLKKTRLGSNEIPENVITYAAELKTVSDKMKIDVAALGTKDDVRNYKIKWPTEPKE